MRRLGFLLLLAACGSDPSTRQSPPPIIQSTPITIVVAKGLKQGVLVLFHDEAGVLLHSARTDESGRASSPSTIAPSQVSVLVGQPGTRRVITYLGVAPGDELIVENPLANRPRGFYRVSLPGPFPSATSYSLRPGSEGASDPKNTFVHAEIPNGTFGAVLGQALGDNSRPLAFAFAKDVPAPTTDDMPLRLGPWVTPIALSVDATNIPPNTATRTTLVETVGEVTRTEAGPPVPSDQAPSAWKGDPSLHIAPGFADSYDVWVWTSPINPNFQAPLASITMLRHFSQPGAPIVFDLGRALPAVESASVDLTEPLRPKIQWQSVPNQNGAIKDLADAGVASISWGSGGGSAGPSADSGTWTFIVPPNTESVRAPILPPEAAAWFPLVNQTSEHADVMFVDVEETPTYAAFRHDLNVMGIQHDRYGLRHDGEARWTSFSNGHL